MTDDDPSNGYEAVAADFMAVRSEAGRDVVEHWAVNFAPGAAVLDVAAGHGAPLTAALIAANLDVFAIDASPAMVAAFRERFPNTPIACEPVEISLFFQRPFDGVLAIGLIFLLPEARQPDVLHRLAGALTPGGRLLFSAPHQVCTWTDVLTGRPSWSLGIGAYTRILKGAGLALTATTTDAGGTHYIHAVKPG